MFEAEFTDPRLVAVYDDLNSYAPGSQPDFYARLADELGAETVVELGCGTGIVARALARGNRRVIGVEPSAQMLAVARAQGGTVEWIEGDANAIGTPDADLAVMSGHVAQFFVDDETWAGALAALGRALRPGGYLAFESRNPGAREWERWTRDHGQTVATAAGVVAQWIEVDTVGDGVVSYDIHYFFVASGDTAVSRGRLRFRAEAELTESLDAAGFTVEAMYGEWDREPVSAHARELIVVAQRR